ncbi:MAG: DUF748 domain-containing protein [Coleofasciculaceae cyanobacterium SM2_3_26]|nr:DUF748 domain-containing protein [Coleofasciculaceae cyanobacterium SM2_3_26]
MSEAIGKILQRPIDIGDVDRFSLTGLRFSTSTLPPTDEDADEAEISAIEVEFNLLEAATNRVLPLHVTLVNPEARIEQDAKGNWIATELNIVESDLLVQPQLRSIRVRGGQVVLIPNDGGQPIEINDANVAVELREENQRIVFDVAANPAGGRVRVEGEAFLPAEEPGEPGDRPLKVDARVLTQNIPLAQVGRAIPNLPLTVRSGVLNTDLEVAFTADEPLPWQEEQLLPLLREGLEVRGKASLRQVAIAIPEVAELVRAEGNFRFQGKRLWVERLLASYGNVTARTDGRIDLREGYNLRAGIEVASWRSLLQTLKLDLPWEAEGALALEARVRGTLTSPLVTVRSRRLPNFLSPEPLATLLNVKGFQAELALSLQRLLLQVRRFEVLPGMGGVVSGKGTVDLQKQVALALDFGLEGVPLDPVILSVLDRETFDALPLSTLGTLSATGRVRGKAEDPDVTANWQILEATYPGRGELRYRNEVLTLANTTFAVDGGAVRLEGTVDLAREAIAATVAADGIQLQTLGAPVSALASARLNLSAPLNLTGLQQVRGNGDATVLLADGGEVRVPEISRKQRTGGGNGAGKQHCHQSPDSPGSVASRGAGAGRYGVAIAPVRRCHQSGTIP